MFDIPGFNPSAMSDEELLAKNADLSRRLNWSMRFGGSGEAATQFQTMIDAIILERQDRLLRFIFKEQEKMFPDVIETDPDFLPAKVAPETEKDIRLRQLRKAGRERMVKTKTPTNNQ